MFAIIDRSLRLDELKAKVSRYRHVDTNEIYFVYEGDTDEPVPDGIVALSDIGIKEPPYFLYPADALHLED
jgi:hypothetical protein